MVISGLACQLAVNFTSPELPSDTGGVVRGCLSGSPGLNSEPLASPASDEEEEDGVLLLLLYMVFFSLIFSVPVWRQTRIDTRIRSQEAAEHYRHRQLQSTVCFSLSCLLFLFLASGPSLVYKELITSSVILQKYLIIRGALPSIGNEKNHPSEDVAVNHGF